MKLTIVIAAHNEDFRLWKTVESCIQSCFGLDYELLVVDDASRDGSVEEALRRFPNLEVICHERRLGASPAKAAGARRARGEVLVFLDGHVKPAPDAIPRLVRDIEETEGQAVITPAIAALDCESWTYDLDQVGHGYSLELESLACGWMGLSELRSVREGKTVFYESPAAIGCALAVGRQLYNKVGGFDPHMKHWGVEDLDFSLKIWLMGNLILHDPQAVIGHRFRESFDNYTVPVEHVLVNQLRLARKNFTQAVWAEWVDRCRLRNPGGLPDYPEGLWARAWEVFEADRASADQERALLLGRRPRDEFWFAERFGLAWPSLRGAPARAEAREAIAALASPSPPPTVFAGLDRSIYPGDAAMQWLKSNTNLAWTGFYLAPAPNHPDTSWMPPMNPTSVRTTLLGMGWGFAPLYLGRQVGSPNLTTAQGTADAQNAAALAQSAGFPSGTVIYLDIEQGGLLPAAMIKYYKAWVQGIVNQGYGPGVYCSYFQSAAQLHQADSRARIWVFHVGRYSCANDAKNPYPTPDTSTSGYALASIWQYLQNCSINVNNTSLSPVDLDSASMRDPSSAAATVRPLRALGAMPSPSQGPPKLQLVLPAAGTQFAIDANAQMPSITARAQITGVTPDPTPTTAFTWTVQVQFQASGCPHGPTRTITMPSIVQTVTGGQFTIPFSLVRGGQLTIKVQATVGGTTLEAQSSGLTIVGTNPPIASIQAALPHDTLRRIARFESGDRQFNAAAGGGQGPCPLFSADNLGGVGIFQITSPAPTDDQVWSWRANVAGGIQIFNQKVRIARGYPAQVRGSTGFKNLVNAFNQKRIQQGLAAIPVTLPDFTSGDFNTNLQQLELDSIRGFNGWGGHDAFGFPLHEFRVALDVQGNLIVNVNAAGTSGTASWVQVPASARPQNFGDPNYVAHVLATSP
jgi:glycosyltransferase involved in cell wall biosynthesis